MSDVISISIESISSILKSILEFFISLFYTNNKLNVIGWLTLAFVFLTILDLIICKVIDFAYGGEKNEKDK